MLRPSLLCSEGASRTTRSTICCVRVLRIYQEALVKFDDQFQSMVAEILRAPCLSEDQLDQASLPVKLSGLGVNQTKVIAASAYVGLTKDLVAALFGDDVTSYEPAGVAELLAAHEVATGAST